MTRPNIVLIQADQLTAKVLSMYGGRTAKTPHMDAIARDGARTELTGTGLRVKVRKFRRL